MIAGAKNPALIKINDNDIQIIKTDNLPISGLRRKSQSSYSDQIISLNKGDKVKIYLCLDGIQDQFGGEHNRKLGRKKLIEKLEEFDSVEKVSDNLKKYINQWRKAGNEKQIDDICLLAFEINP